MKTINPYKLFVGAFVPNWLMERTEISAGAKLCYGRLSQHAGKNGLCIPSQETLSKELGVKDRQLRNYLGELVKCELIHIERRGLNHTNSYTFFDHPWIADQERQDSASQNRQDSADIRESTKRSSSSEELRSSSSSRGEEDRPKFLNKLSTWYNTLTPDHPGLRSPVKTPSRYFKKLCDNGDSLTSFRI
ncbi:MAG: helix-turn-helix domain-containing protein, partial [Nitrosopumilus sp.]